MTRYSVQLRDNIQKRWWFLVVVTNMSRNLSSKYKKKPIYHATDVFKTAPKEQNQITAEATSDLIGNKISDKITGP